MQANVGTRDKVARYIAAVILVVLGAMAQAQGQSPWVWGVLFAIAAVLTLTAAVRFCPAYVLFGVRTCGAKSDHTE